MDYSWLSREWKCLKCLTIASTRTRFSLAALATNAPVKLGVGAINVSEKLGIPDYEFRMVFGRTRIDYDPKKEEANRAKHGYSLESAVYFLEGLLFPTSTPRPHAVSDAFLENNEVRHMHMCVDDRDNVVLMVTTMRPNETVRVISLRKAHPDEREEFRRLTGYVQPQC